MAIFMRLSCRIARSISLGELHFDLRDRRRQTALPRRRSGGAGLANGNEEEYYSLMQVAQRIAAAPSKPLMVYDGDCSFCLRWIQRWQRRTGDCIDYLPYQNAAIAS